VWLSVTLRHLDITHLPPPFILYSLYLSLSNRLKSLTLVTNDTFIPSRYYTNIVSPFLLLLGRGISWASGETTTIELGREIRDTHLVIVIPRRYGFTGGW
jgi:hypothetical protein